MSKRVLFAVNAFAGEDLRAGEKDIMKLYSVFTDEEIGNCDEGLSKHQFNCKSKSDFQVLLDDFLNDWNSENQLIFYFSGHGQVRNNNYYLKFGDKNKVTSYPFKNLINDFESVEVSKALIIIDACYSGKITKANSEDSKINQHFHLPKGYIFFSSSAESELSYEFDDGSSSIFTHMICQGLRTGLNGAQTKDGYIYASDLQKYFQNELKNGKFKDYCQNPECKQTNSNEPIWIAKNKSGKIQNPNPKGSDNLEGVVHNLDELRHLYEITEKNEHPCPNAEFEGLDWQLIENFFKVVRPQNLNWDDLTNEKRLHLLNLLSPIKVRGKRRLKKSAVICFHQTPELYYPHLTTKFVVGPSRKYLKSQEIKGPLTYQIERLKNLIEDNLDVSYFDDKGDRRKSPFTTEDLEVIREIISNAYSHRNYLDESSIQVNILPDYIEVRNPGSFPAGLSWQFFINSNDITSKPNNPFISLYLNKQLKSEGIGRGFDIIREYLKKYGNDSITSKEVNNSLVIVRIKLKENYLEFFENNKREKNQSKIPNIIGHLPILPEVFLGRQSELKMIHDSLFINESNLILVSGAGGIGKTSVASSYYHRFKPEYNHLAWVYAENGIMEGLLNISLDLGVEFDSNTLKEERFSILLNNLSQLSAPSLIVIDNADNIDDLEKHYPALRSLTNFHLLITSRVSKFANVPVLKMEGLTQANALELFNTYYKKVKKEDTPILKEIIKAVDHNTLILELLAKSLANQNTFGTKYSMQTLLQDLQKSILDLSSDVPVETVYRFNSTEAITQATVADILLAMYRLENLTEAEKQIASIFSLLPTEAIPFGILKLILEDIKIEAPLKMLINRGWLYHDSKENAIKINQVVQEVVRQKQQSRLKKDSGLLITNLIKFLRDDLSFQKDFIRITQILVRYAESILNALKTQAGGDFLQLLEAVGDFYIKIGDLSSAMDTYWQMCSVAQQLNKLNPENTDFKNGLAISYSKLGQTHAEFGEINKALEFYQKQVSLSQELYQENPNQASFKNGLAISYSKLGDTHADLGKLDKALEFYQKYNQLELELYQEYPNQVSHKNGLAISYSNLGQVYAQLGNLNKALEFYQKYNQLELELYQEYPNQVSHKNGLAISYSNLGQVYAQLGNLNKALEFYQKYNQLELELDQEYPNQVSFKHGLAISYSKLGQTHAALGILDKALEFYQKDVELTKELYQEYPNQISFKNGLAISYEKLGEAHEALDNLDSALEFYQNYNQLEQELHNEYPNTVAFKNGLAISYSKLGEVHAALGKLDKALEFYQKYRQLEEELYQEYPNHVSFKNELAISLVKLGVFYTENQLDTTKARSYFKEAKTLWEELVNYVPKMQEYHKNLELVKKYLN
jgi:tetratricopeptide (TPR) repeat protein